MLGETLQLGQAPLNADNLFVNCPSYVPFTAYMATYIVIRHGSHVTAIIGDSKVRVPIINRSLAINSVWKTEPIMLQRSIIETLMTRLSPCNLRQA